MRTRLLALTCVALLGSVIPGRAQQPQANDGLDTGSIDVGLRLFGVDGDEARPQRYRDLRDGLFLENVRYTRDRGEWLFDATLDHAGYRNQRYSARFTRFGALKAWFEWDQIPLFYSIDSRTLYNTESDGVLRIGDDIQRGIESGQSSIGTVAPLAGQFDLRQRRDVARFGVSASPRKNLDLTLELTSTHREGAMPWGASFGFNHAVEVAVPLDQRTTDLDAAAEWGNDGGSLRVQYDGSWFNNEVQTLVWDNPLTLTDATYPTAYVDGRGTSQGRMALWPNSTMHAVSVTGTKRLPARSHATAHVSIGSWNQDQDLLPFTINSALPTIDLPRQSAEAEALVTALNFTFTSRPTRRTWLNLRYRRYDFDNQTEPFPIDEYVRLDQVVEPFPLEGSEPFGYVRSWFDADFSYTLTPFLALRAGYGLEDVERTFRLTESTTEHTFRASVDSTGSPVVSVRGVYEHAARTASGLDEQVLDNIGEQVSLRQFDISDRDRDRVSAIVQVTPVATLGINGTIGAGRDDRPDARFGLREAQTRFYSLGVDVVPNEIVSAGLTWGFDKYSSLQRSRQANPGPEFDDPTRDWSTDASDRVHYVTASLALLQAIPKTDVQLGYDFNRSRGRYVYGLTADSTLPPVQQLPEVVNELQRATLDVKYFFARRLAAGMVYWYDKYVVDDFALDGSAIPQIDMPGGLLLGYVWRPYTAHTVSVRLSYFW